MQDQSRLAQFAAHALGGYCATSSTSGLTISPDTAAKLAMEAAMALEQQFQGLEAKAKSDAEAQEDKAREPYLKGKKAVRVVPTPGGHKYFIRAADVELDIVPAMRFNSIPDGENYAKSNGMEVAAKLRKI